ncbi:MAG: TrkH family potassium uptake protein [bacterium]
MNRFYSLAGPSGVVTLSFAFVIAVGAFLLWLPLASTENPLSFVDALFTSTSATCVTGLVVVDTGYDLSLFGQLVVLSLIQIGGLGIMTYTTLFLFVLGGKFSLKQRFLLQESLSQFPVHDFWRLLRFVFGIVIFCEGIGAVLLFAVFFARASFLHAAYSAIFHSVSAFCNAGFGLYSKSLMDYQNNPWLVGIISTLIVLGGLGFLVIVESWDWLDARFRGAKPARISVQSRLVYITSASLILLGTVVFLVLESNHSFRNQPFGGKLLSAFFQSVTARTAGFNTVDIGAMGDASQFFLVILMFIGGSPGSTAGGIKTTTFAVFIALLISRFRGRPQTQVFRRAIPSLIIDKALSIILLSSLIIVTFAMVLLTIEEEAATHGLQFHFLDYLFELVSAFGTVGLSTGVTPTLTAWSKLLLVLTMFIGRLGPLTVSLLIVERGGRAKIEYPEANVMVG